MWYCDPISQENAMLGKWFLVRGWNTVFNHYMHVVLWSDHKHLVAEFLYLRQCWWPKFGFGFDFGHVDLGICLRNQHWMKIHKQSELILKIMHNLFDNWPTQQKLYAGMILGHLVSQAEFCCLRLLIRLVMGNDPSISKKVEERSITLAID